MDLSFTRRALFTLASLATTAARALPSPRLDLGGNKVTWLGFSTVKVETADGRVLLIDPWLSAPGSPVAWKDFGRLDAMLVTHGHWQHIGEAVELAKAKGCPVLAVEEVAHWLADAGVKSTPQVNIGATVELAGVRVSVTPAVHTSGLLDRKSGFIGYGGDPVGFVLHLPGNVRVYHAGDTDVFGDMALIKERWRPRLAILPIGDVTTMGPAGAALACNLLGADAVLPIHYDDPKFTGKPEHLEAELRRRSATTLLWAAKPGAPLS